MQADNTNMHVFLSTQGQVHIVPVYQRNSAWTGIDCKKLFYDIEELTALLQKYPPTEEVPIPINPDSGYDINHFLGAITIKYFTAKGKDCHLIDGQQRITNMMLLIKAIHDVTDDKSLKAKIEHWYLFNSEFDTSESGDTLKLRLHDLDNDVFRIIVLNDFSTATNLLTSAQLESKIYINYKIFHDLVLKSDFRNNLSLLIDSFYFLTLILNQIEKENPQQIYDRLNSTGQHLSTLDLVRNYFFMSFPSSKQEVLNNDYWSSIENAVGIDNLTHFFLAYFVYKFKTNVLTISGCRTPITDHSLKDVFEYYFDHELHAIGNYDKTILFLKDLMIYASYYKNTVFDKHFVLDSATELQRNLYFVMLLDGGSCDSRIILFYLYDLLHKNLITESVINQCLHILCVYMFRARVCSKKSITKQSVSSILRSLLKCNDYSRFVDCFWRSIFNLTGIYSMPSDYLFRTRLIESSLYLNLKKEYTKYLLYMLELNSKYCKGLPQFNDDKKSTQIEHVMPQTLNSDWKNYLGKDALNYSSYVHRLGNLCLINYNQSLGNKFFNLKKETYSNSNFFYTRELGKCSEWNYETIQERSERLADICLKIWAIPVNYRDFCSDNSLVEHKLNENFSQMDDCIIESFRLDEDDVYVDAWNSLLLSVSKELVKVDKYAFSNVVNSHKLKYFYKHQPSLFDNKVNSHYVHIVDNIYFMNPLHRKYTVVLETLRKLVKKFDFYAGTDYYSSFSFFVRV